MGGQAILVCGASVLGGAQMAYEAPEVSQRILSAACSVSPVRGTVRGSWRGAAVGEGPPIAGLLPRTLRPCCAANCCNGPSTAATDQEEGCSGRAVGR